MMTGSGMNDMRDIINALCRKRADLKLQGRTRDMIRIQRKIIRQARKTGNVRRIAIALNYLSSLSYKLCSYEEAESAAVKALRVYTVEERPQDEVLGCYKFILAQI